MHQSPHAPAAISSSTRHGRPSGCSTNAWRQRWACRCAGGGRLTPVAVANACSSSRATSGAVRLEMIARPRHRGVHDPGLRPGRALRLARITGRPGQRALGPAAHLGADVDRLVERHHCGPARRHPHLGQVPERAAVGPEQRECLRRRHGHRHGIEKPVLAARVGLQFPAALALQQLVHADAGLQFDGTRHRSHRGAHAGHADVPFLDRRVPCSGRPRGCAAATAAAPRRARRPRRT